MDNNNCFQHTQRLRELIELEYPEQKNYSGVLRDIYILTNDIDNNRIVGNINFSSLARQFVDDTTQYDSPILKTLKDLEVCLNKKRR